MKRYCTTCDELRTDSFDDAWGFAFVAAVPQCLRCGSIVDLKEKGQAQNFVEEETSEGTEIGG